jgi:DNA replication and repair protein RecF
VSLEQLELTAFRSFAHVRFEPEPQGTTVIAGPNGSGKTTLLEAVAYLGTQRSFRGAPREVMIKTGDDRAVVRASLTGRDHHFLVEAELVAAGRSRIQVNRQPARDRRTLAEAVPVTVFSPEDLVVVRGAPSARRDLLDDALALLDPKAGTLRDEVDRILRQRTALLRQSSGRLSDEVAVTLDVWDERLAEAGARLIDARERLSADLEPFVDASYQVLAGASGGLEAPDGVALEYRRSFEGELAVALAGARLDDVRRGVSTLGPHRDDLQVSLAGRDARLQASQGEQRCIALALRLAVHHLVTERTALVPILLLDDVFSELDPARSRALLGELPSTQALLTTAVPIPDGVAVARILDIRSLDGGGGVGGG